MIWTGANDGPYHVTRDNGKSWTNVTPKDLPPGGRVQTVEPSPHRPGSAYVAVLRYLLGDFKPYAYKTDDYGATWRLLTTGSNGIPADEPVRVVREDPVRPGLLYAGTEFGVYVSFDDGARWHSLRNNLPVVPVTDLRVHQGDLVISTQGRSFWILDDVSPLRQLADSATAARAHLFRPRDAWRMRYSAGFGGVESSRATPDAPQYPPAGATIAYWLGPETSGPVTLDILQGDRVIRSFSSETPEPRARGGAVAAGAEGEPGAESAPGGEAAMRERPEGDTAVAAMQRAGTQRLPKQPGLNRMVWDLAHPGPWDANTERRGRNGPIATPGTYRIRLNAGGVTETQPLVVREDPRVVRDGVTARDLEAQLAHNLAVRDLVSDANRLVARVQSARRAAGAAVPDSLVRLERALLGEPVRYGRPGLLAQITYLYGLTTAADQRIGRDAVERYRVLRAELDAMARRAEGVLGGR